jgi:uncharacterized membrane protein (DUF373 family)
MNDRGAYVFIVAMIAVGRHVIEIDYESVEPMSLLGVAALVLALGRNDNHRGFMAVCH